MTSGSARSTPRLLIVGIALARRVALVPVLRRVAPTAAAAEARPRHSVSALRGGIVVLVGAAAGLVARTSSPMRASRTSRRPRASRCASSASASYAVSVQAPGGPPRHFEVLGDEWQIDARVLKWRALGTLLGFDTVYRLERLSGRYGDVQPSAARPRTRARARRRRRAGRLLAAWRDVSRATCRSPTRSTAARPTCRWPRARSTW